MRKILPLVFAILLLASSSSLAQSKVYEIKHMETYAKGISVGKQAVQGIRINIDEELKKVEVIMYGYKDEDRVFKIIEGGSKGNETVYQLITPSDNGIGYANAMIFIDKFYRLIRLVPETGNENVKGKGLQAYTVFQYK